MTVTVLQPSATEWNALVAAAPGPSTMFQTYELGQVKRRGGWRPLFLLVDDVPVAVHVKKAPGFGSVWYVPKGPVVPDVEALRPLVPQLAEQARQDGAFLLKIEPELIETPQNRAALESMGLIHAGRIQNSSSTIVLDISGDGEELLARLPSRTRNTIRRGEKQGVRVEQAPADEASYERMWTLWQQVVADQGIFTRDKASHVATWRAFCEAGTGRLFFATHEGRDIAAAFVTVVGEMANYREGASVRERPVRGAAQYLQYVAMQWAQQEGATRYDMCGTPHSTKVDDPEEPLHGVGGFKRGFSKDITDYVGAYDLPLRRWRYAAWQRVGHRLVARLGSRGASAASFY